MYKKMVAVKDDFEQAQKLLEQKSKSVYKYPNLSCTDAYDMPC